MSPGIPAVCRLSSGSQTPDCRCKRSDIFHNAPNPITRPVSAVRDRCRAITSRAGEEDGLELAAGWVELLIGMAKRSALTTAPSPPPINFPNESL